MSALPRVAYVSPLPPDPSGIADYSAELLPYLDRYWEIDLFVEGEAPDPSVVQGRRTIDIAKTDPLPLLGDYDAVLYHIGNSPSHATAYQTFVQHPGFVVLHDESLIHLIVELAGKAGRYDQLYQELRRQHGDDAAETLRRHVYLNEPAPWDAAPLAYPLNRRILEQARGVLVHSRFVAERIRASHPDCPVQVLPMHALGPDHFDVPLPEIRRNPDTLVVTTAGYLTPAKRIGSVLRAIRQLRPEVQIHYKLVGEASPELRLESLIRDLGVRDCVTLLGRVDAAELYRELCDSDVCVNLRHPNCGETSAMALRALACGRPLLASDDGWFRELPDDCAIKVDIGEDEVDSIARALAQLAAEPDRRAAMSSAARAYTAPLDPESRADAYRRFVTTGVERSLRQDLISRAAELGLESGALADIPDGLLS